MKIKQITMSELACKLTTSELQNRKKKVITSLLQKATGKQNVKQGYSISFPYTEEILDEISEFIKTERSCCPFFTFNLVVHDKIGLRLTGPEGTRKFLKDELGF